MSLRSQLKHLSLEKSPPFYLVYFYEDETVSIIKAGDLVELPNSLEVGSFCHVKVKKKVYEGRVVTFGLEEEVRNVEDQFLNEVYTPDFLLDDRDACIAADTASNNTTVDLTKTADVLTDSDTCISNKVLDQDINVQEATNCPDNGKANNGRKRKRNESDTDKENRGTKKGAKEGKKATTAKKTDKKKADK
uniref:Uncharacterized protein n=1 Tax=Amphimedon queenslandica TaxID=400682 RepID=A0A1X7SNN5_AMPQE